MVVPPTAVQVVDVEQETPASEPVAGSDCLVQLFPPFVVATMAEPTATQEPEATQLTPRRLLVPDGTD
jgi:hypothetical protein